MRIGISPPLTGIFLSSTLPTLFGLLVFVFLREQRLHGVGRSGLLAGFCRLQRVDRLAAQRAQLDDDFLHVLVEIAHPLWLDDRGRFRRGRLVRGGLVGRRGGRGAVGSVFRLLGFGAAYSRCSQDHDEGQRGFHGLTACSFGALGASADRLSWSTWRRRAAAAQSPRGSWRSDSRRRRTDARARRAAR